MNIGEEKKLTINISHTTYINMGGFTAIRFIY
jgi:hypothetical protein